MTTESDCTPSALVKLQELPRHEAAHTHLKNMGEGGREKEERVRVHGNSRKPGCIYDRKKHHGCDIQ